VFSAIGKGLRTVDLKDENIVEIVAFAADLLSRVTSLNDRLYYTDPMRSEVVCCDFNGTILWKFTDKSVLKTTRSVTAENTNVPFIEVIPLHAVLVLIDFTVFPVLRSTSVMNV
jgi:hypothetical protein